MQDFFNEALSVLRADGTILYPTDTIWGLGCDATSGAAVEKIFQIKQRDRSKSMLVLARHEWIEGCPATALPYFNSVRPTTVILPLGLLPAMPPLSHALMASDGTIGVRLPRHDFCQALLAALGHPLVSTSANFSGQPSPATFDDIDPRLVSMVDHVVENRPEFVSSSPMSSRIVKIGEKGEVVTLRP